MNNEHINEPPPKSLSELGRKDSHEKPITREQRRYQERVQQDAMRVLNKLVTAFYEFFMDNEPDSPEVTTKRKELVAKWKMYCHQKKLLPAALGLADENIQKIIDKYNEQLKEA